eukprot:4397357-Pleurochrysis_carterae.AAC.1
MGNARHRCPKIRHVCDSPHLPAVRARRNSSEVDNSARECWTITITTKFVEPPLSTLNTHQHGRRIENAGGLDISSTLGLSTRLKLHFRSRHCHAPTFGQPRTATC